MRQTYWQTEQERLNVLVEEYRSSGYDVLVGPRADQLPAFLQGLQPDLVVSKGEEHIVIEVSSRPTLKDKPLSTLANAVKGQPGWHLELVVANPPNSEAFGDVYQTLDARQLGEMLDRAESIRSADPHYAAILTWVAVEGALVERLAEAEEAVPSRGPKRLIKEAISLGLVEPDDHAALERLAEFRSRFVHAMVADAPSSEDLDAATRVARDLLASPVAS